MQLTNEFEPIRDWAKEKGIIEKGTVKGQFIKLLEEVEELNNAIIEKDQNELIDAVGDCVVVLTNLAELAGVKIEYCINSAYNEIKNRKGVMKNGTFEKE
jgi:NTP pyrophosphatase (non-canonical NTP hydrolase)